jgi:uncharacterized protein (TIGR03000 family)
MYRTCWIGLLLLVALTAGSQRAGAGDETIGRREHVSPPGWFGPGPAWHKWSDPGPGAGWTYHGVPNGPTVIVPPQTVPRARFGSGWWGIPGAAGSFWTNGQSLYGPPVPTYAPIPGSFGGSDYGKHFFKNPPPANSIWVGLGWHGYRTPSPRPASPSVSVWPQGPAAAPAADGACIMLAVKVPTSDADVWVEKTQVTQAGTDRLFQSPPLEAGGTYRYEVVARWKAGGLERAESRSVTGTPGQTLSVDFTTSAEVPAVPAK